MRELVERLARTTKLVGAFFRSLPVLCCSATEQAVATDIGMIEPGQHAPDFELEDVPPVVELHDDGPGVMVTR
jgi:hypothetical protein